MLRKSVCVLIVVMSLSPSLIFAQGLHPPRQEDALWQAMYWNNPLLDGAPVVTRSEETVNHNWGTGSPHDRVPLDGFSARWSRYVEVTRGTYRFIITSDDGVRMWIDDELVLDAWYDHAEKTFYVDHHLSQGVHLIKIEYYENSNIALMQFSWLRADQAVGRWRGEYYNNMTLEGDPVLVRNEPHIDFGWYTSSPDPDVIQADHFSARWTRTLDFPAGNYRFTLTVDDGARLWVNGQLLIDVWYDQEATVYTEDMYLSAGPVILELQYYENTGYARAQLSWTPPVFDIPTSEAVIVDNQDLSFVEGGSPNRWHTAPEGYARHLVWTYNNERVIPKHNWARWYPDIAPGSYEVFVYVPFRPDATAQARYWVSHADGLSLQVVNQALNAEQWVSIGTYRFRGDGSDHVSLADVTFEARESKVVIFDAVKWELRYTK